MDKIDRYFRIHQILSNRRTPIPAAALADELECTDVSVRRLIQGMRTHLSAPIETCHNPRGYRYDLREGETYELPGLWFNTRELQALVTLNQLLDTLGDGLLREHLAPLEKRMEQLISKRNLGLSEVPQRVRLLSQGKRSPGAYFTALAEGTLQRKRIGIRYHSRGKDGHSERAISPQRITHYRDNWYLDAWCHLADALRTFSIDRILDARVLDEPAIDIPQGELDAQLASAFGIFSGKAAHTAILRFTPERARWVAEEIWHPEQRGHWREDGRYELHIPYGQPEELLMDILKYGPDVEVIAPDSLRGAVHARIEQALNTYSSG